MYEAQPAIPGLDGPEWVPQPPLPYEADADLTDADLMQALDVLHGDIVAAEQTGEEPQAIDLLLYDELDRLAVERGLIEPTKEDLLWQTASVVDEQSNIYRELAQG